MANPGSTADVLDVDPTGTLVSHRFPQMDRVTGAMCLGDSGNPFVYAVIGTFDAIYAEDFVSGNTASLIPSATNIGSCGAATDSGRTLVSSVGQLWSLEGSAATPQPLGDVVTVASDAPGFSVLLARDVTVVHLDENLSVVSTRALAPGVTTYDAAIGIGPACEVVSYSSTEGGPATLVQVPR
ncbi:MAG TPA: hypothetical protein VLT45_15910 [Kofleriaceae bacterium]|nr:hypothetical protein [Kofleriaceae bacterium]